MLRRPYVSYHLFYAHASSPSNEKTSRQAQTLELLQGASSFRDTVRSCVAIAGKNVKVGRS